MKYSQTIGQPQQHSFISPNKNTNVKISFVTSPQRPLARSQQIYHQPVLAERQAPVQKVNQLNSFQPITKSNQIPQQITFKELNPNQNNFQYQ